MKLDRKKLLLYAVTDRRWEGKENLYEQLENALIGGVTCVQLREKEMSEVEFLNEAEKIKILCNNYNVPLFINDNVNVAMKVHADGIHVGQDDMDVKKVRNIVGNSMYIGVSAHNIEEAINAEIEGADYIGVGTIFSTSTKLDAEIVSIEMLSEICKSVKIPVVAIGGLNENNILKLSKTGIDGVAIVSNIFSSDNIKEKCERLCEIIKSIVRN